MNFVLDASVCVRWALIDGSKKDRDFADKVLTSLTDNAALVPPLWHIEVLSVLRGAEKQKHLTEAASTHFLQSLSKLPIYTDQAAPTMIGTNISALARQYGLTGYDATYLELSIRHGIPLATLDQDLLKAAKKAGVVIFNAIQ